MYILMLMYMNTLKYVACDLSTQWVCRVRKRSMSSIRGDQLRRSVSRVMAGIWSPASTQLPATSPCLFLSTLRPASALTLVRSPSRSVYWSSIILCNLLNRTHCKMERHVVFVSWFKISTQLKLVSLKTILLILSILGVISWQDHQIISEDSSKHSKNTVPELINVWKRKLASS